MSTRRRSSVWALLRLATAALIAAAVVTQLVVSLSATARAGGDVATVFANFFSFFTILSNVIAVAALTWAGAASFIAPGRERTSTPLSVVLACATTYMLITGIVYNALLRFIPLPVGGEPVPWSNEVLHLIGPLFLLLDLAIGTTRRALRWRAVGLVVAFPLVWTAYTLVRGPLVTNPLDGRPYWYPYPFLNPNAPGGWSMVATYVAVIALAFVAVGFATVWWTTRRARAVRPPVG